MFQYSSIYNVMYVFNNIIIENRYTVNGLKYNIQKVLNLVNVSSIYVHVRFTLYIYVYAMYMFIIVTSLNLILTIPTAYFIWNAVGIFTSSSLFFF